MTNAKAKSNSTLRSHRSNGSDRNGAGNITSRLTRSLPRSVISYWRILATSCRAMSASFSCTPSRLSPGRKAAGNTICATRIGSSSLSAAVPTTNWMTGASRKSRARHLILKNYSITTFSRAKVIARSPAACIMDSWNTIIAILRRASIPAMDRACSTKSSARTIVTAPVSVRAIPSCPRLTPAIAIIKFARWAVSRIISYCRPGAQ